VAKSTPQEQLFDRLGLVFDAQLLELALTHRSFAYESGGLPTNERLEFLGDSVLGVVVTDALYHRYPDLPEGNLAKLRSAVVSARALAVQARRIGLGEFIRLGRGEETTGGRDKSSILADTFEAILAAVFLDGGYVAAQQLIERLYVPILASVDPLTLGKDAKTLLQEFLQSRQYALPVYSVVATHGAAHSQQFEVECSVPVLDIKVVAAGASRRAAEQSAAKLALVAAEAASPAPAKKRSTRARKTAQLTLPVAVAQELK
jgi:ribonuclease-3